MLDIAERTQIVADSRATDHFHAVRNLEDVAAVAVDPVHAIHNVEVEVAAADFVLAVHTSKVEPAAADFVHTGHNLEVAAAAADSVQTVHNSQAAFAAADMAVVQLLPGRMNSCSSVH